MQLCYCKHISVQIVSKTLNVALTLTLGIAIYLEGWLGITVQLWAKRMGPHLAPGNEGNVRLLLVKKQTDHQYRAYVRLSPPTIGIFAAPLSVGFAHQDSSIPTNYTITRCHRMSSPESEARTLKACEHMIQLRQVHHKNIRAHKETPVQPLITTRHNPNYEKLTTTSLSTEV